MSRFRLDVGQLAIHALLVVLAVFTLVPLATLINLSFKDPYQFNLDPMGPAWPLTLENYTLAWRFMRDPLVHNIVIGVVAIAASLAMAALTAFVFARFEFPGRDLLFFALLLILLVPSTVLLVPTYQLIIQFKLLNTLWALILPYAAHQSLIIIVLRSFFADLSSEIFDAARVDGAGVLQLFWHLAVPLSLPVLCLARPGRQRAPGAHRRRRRDLLQRRDVPPRTRRRHGRRRHRLPPDGALVPRLDAGLCGGHFGRRLERMICETASVAPRSRSVCSTARPRSTGSQRKASRRLTSA